MKKKILAVLCAVLMLIVVCTGCGGKKIQGEWKQIVNGVELYGFTFTDTTVEMFVAGSSTGTYDYTIIDDDTIKTTSAGSESEWTYSLSGNKLTLTISSYGSPIELTRQ